MKKISIVIFTLSFVFLAFVSCKKPKPVKTNVQQTIETPVMQMAEAPAESQISNLKSQIAESEISNLKSSAGASTLITAPASTTVIKSSSNIEIVIDASGSMNAPIDQTTKIDAVRSALKDAFSVPLPPELANRKVAIRSYGNRSTADKNDCADTALELPMKKYNSDEFAATLDKILPKGGTPLAFALEEANRDFTENADTSDNIIVLITDGLDLCNGDALAAAERLHKKTSKVMIDVIAFDVDQTAQDYLKKLATATSGSFFLARSSTELASAVDQAVSANLPYNLRVKVLSGASPVPSLITAYRANTQAIVEKTESSGIKFFKLEPGSYDILVEYKASIEAKKPSKIIKGVEVTATSKAEQIVQFELGNISVTALDQNDQPARANFYLRRSGSDEIVGSLISTQSPAMVHISPGTYDIDAESVETGMSTLTAQVKGVEVAVGKTTEQSLKFQTGKLLLKAQNVAKQNIPISYRITKPDSNEVIVSGEGPADGTTIELAPANYDVYATWKDPNIQGSPEAKLSNVKVAGGETLEQFVTIITGTLKLSGKDSHGKMIHTEFSIRKVDTTEEIAKASSDISPVEVFAAPGEYDIVATDTTSKVIPAPSVAWNKIVVKEGQSQTLSAEFKLGTIKFIGKNAKERAIETTFTVYRSGTDEPLVTENSKHDFVTFNLTPSFYDVKAEETNAKSDPKPEIWFHDLEILEGKTITNEAIFTSGKLKLICRGKNNVVLTCEFNVFTYGADTALFSGSTADEWREFDIPPGKYYMEAGWHDPVEEQFLKKWINVSIGENQIVEEVLRF